MEGRAEIRHATGWVWRLFRGSVLCVGPDGAAVQLDGAAAVVWAATEHPTTPSELVERVAERCDGAPGAPEDLLAGAVRDLLHRDMISLIDGP